MHGAHWFSINHSHTLNQAGKKKVYPSRLPSSPAGRLRWCGVLCSSRHASLSRCCYGCVFNSSSPTPSSLTPRHWKGKVSLWCVVQRGPDKGNITPIHYHIYPRPSYRTHIAYIHAASVYRAPPWTTVKAKGQDVTPIHTP